MAIRAFWLAVLAACMALSAEAGSVSFQSRLILGNANYLVRAVDRVGWAYGVDYTGTQRRGLIVKPDGSQVVIPDHPTWGAPHLVTASKSGRVFAAFSQAPLMPASAIFEWSAANGYQLRYTVNQGGIFSMFANNAGDIAYSYQYDAGGSTVVGRSVNNQGFSGFWFAGINEDHVFGGFQPFSIEEPSNGYLADISTLTGQLFYTYSGTWEPMSVVGMNSDFIAIERGVMFLNEQYFLDTVLMNRKFQALLQSNNRLLALMDDGSMITGPNTPLFETQEGSNPLASLADPSIPSDVEFFASDGKDHVVVGRSVGNFRTDYYLLTRQP